MYIIVQIKPVKRSKAVDLYNIVTKIIISNTGLIMKQCIQSDSIMIIIVSRHFRYYFSYRPQCSQKG